MDVRAKKKLDEVAARLSSNISNQQQSTVTAEEIIRVFKNQQQKYSNEKLFKFLQANIKPHILDGDKLCALYETNTKKLQKSPYDALVIMMNSATVLQAKPPIAEKPNLTKLSVKSEGAFESPALSSTRYEANQPEIVVSEVKKIVKFLLDL